MLNKDTAYTYDLYTVHGHDGRTALGITAGLVAVDIDGAAKGRREMNFPPELLDKGISFECGKAEASMPEDQKRIMAEIGEGNKTLLDDTVHGVVAASTLEMVLKRGDKAESERYLAAVCHARQLRVDVSGSAADNDQNASAVVEALESCEMLDLHFSQITMLSAHIGRLINLKNLSLKSCSSLQSLPDSECPLVSVNGYACP